MTPSDNDHHTSAVERHAMVRPSLVLASRGDALTPYLFAELERRYPVAGRLNPELARWQRYAVAAATFRPSRLRWAEQFYKSGFGYSLRTANARRRATSSRDPVLQVHTLFEVQGAPSLLYVDCTHRQSARQWPAWNPLRGPALARWYDRETRAYRGALHVFAFSRQTRESLLADYGLAPDRVSVVGAGVNVHRLPGAPQIHSGGPPTILFVGNDFARKGGRTLLTAFAAVRRRIPGARLLLVGTPPHVAAQPGVQVLGRLHDPERVLALYRQADVFCLPSTFDPYPLVLLEAMAHGLPCVATPTCGVPDIVTDGRDGILVEPGDPVGLSRALIGVLEDPQRAAELGAAGRRRVMATFTWQHVVDRMVPVLDDALRR